jgi:8-oxo-dGTP diphosphatase
LIYLFGKLVVMTSERHYLRVAVYLILIKDNKILLLRRFNTGWRDGFYTLPAGHFDGAETIAEAMSREAAEEIGVKVKPENLQVVHVVHQVMDKEYIDFYLVAKEWEGEPKLMEKDKCDDLNWFSLDNLPERLLPNVKEALLNYQKDITYSEYS